MSMNIGEWLSAFSTALNAQDEAAAASLFNEECYWRDLVAFTWNLKTVEGRSAIEAMLRERLALVGRTHWQVEEGAEDASEGFINFETSQGRGRGYVRLQDGKCYTLLTTMEEIKGHEEINGTNRPVHIPGDASGNWKTRLEDEKRELGHKQQPYVLIIGGGQGGLAMAARLRQMQVPTLVVDRFARSGDQWRARYASLSLHDPVWYDHMPYLPFPDTWPVFTPKDMIADWLESYEEIMELNVWHSTECTGARYDEAAERWEVTLNREGEAITLQPEHLVLAMGNAGKAITPEFKGMQSFKGKQYHSSEFPGSAGLSGQRVVVVGSNNSAHDICGDLVDHGASVTMVQRSSTFIFPQEELIKLLADYYSEEAVANGLTTERADLLFASLPYRILPGIYQPLVKAMRERQAEFYGGLEKAGFMLDFGDDDTGMLKYVRRASGYYIDVGAASLVADGTIGLRSEVEVEAIEPEGVLLSSGEVLPADIIIYATGFGSMDEMVGDLISPEVAKRVGKAWGYGSDTTGDPGPWEGEIRNMWKPTAQSGLWFHGGNLAQSRFYSLFLALQLKARFEKMETPVYQLTEPADA